MEDPFARKEDRRSETLLFPLELFRKVSEKGEKVKSITLFRAANASATDSFVMQSGDYVQNQLQDMVKLVSTLHVEVLPYFSI